MGSINIFKPLSTSFEPAQLINHSNINNFSSEIFWECKDSNPGLLGEKQVCYLCAMEPLPSVITIVSKGQTLSTTATFFVIQGP